jgi:hypothetical protein
MMINFVTTEMAPGPGDSTLTPHISDLINSTMPVDENVAMKLWEGGENVNYSQLLIWSPVHPSPADGCCCHSAPVQWVPSFLLSYWKFRGQVSRFQWQVDSNAYDYEEPGGRTYYAQS